MDDLEEFEFWLGEYVQGFDMAISEAERLLRDMCARGNQTALRFAEAHPDSEAWRSLPADPDEIAEDELDPELDRSAQGPPVVQAREREYVAGWPLIAHDLKVARNWQCEICRFTGRGSGLIQVHHINEDKADNVVANLQVLCAICHGAQHHRGPSWPFGVTDAEKAMLSDHHANR